MHEILQRLNSADEAERIYAVYDIAELSNAIDFVPSLIERLKVEDVQAVRNAIADALKAIDTTRHFDLVFELFSSDDAYLRNCAVELFAVKGDDAVAYLTSKLDHTNHEVRKLIIDSLVEIKTDDSIMAIRAALHDPAINVRITAAEYLGRLADSSSVNDLVDAFEREDEPMMRSAILNALMEIGDSRVFGRISSLVSLNNLTNDVMVYLPELLRFTAKLGSQDDILKTLEALRYSSVYGADIAEFISDALRVSPEIVKNAVIKQLLEQLKNDGYWEGD